MFQIDWTKLVCHNWFVTRNEIYLFVLYMACGGIIFIKKISNFREKKFHFILFHLIFLCYYCSINLKRQSEHSGLRPDTSSIVTFFNQVLKLVSLFFSLLICQACQSRIRDRKQTPGNKISYIISNSVNSGGQ